MDRDTISVRQLLVLLFTALLSPAVQTLPRRSAAIAGEAGWLSTLIALPALLLLCWGLGRLLCSAQAGEGLAEALPRVLGRPLGKGVTLLYLLWALTALATDLRSFSQRFMSTGYRNISLRGFILVLLVVVLWVARGKLAAFARAGEVFYLILSLALGGVLLFALGSVEAKNVLPVWAEDLPAAAASAVPALGVMGYAVCGAFLLGQTAPRKGDGRRALRWAAAFCLLLAVLQFINIGGFGAGLIARMETPLFMLAKSIGVSGGFQRVESVVVAVWALSDLTLVGVLTFACCHMAQALFGLRRVQTAALPVVLLGGIGACLFPDSFALRRFSETVLMAGNLIFGFGIPFFVILLARLRRKEKIGGRYSGNFCEETEDVVVPKKVEKKAPKKQKKC